jgi:hypothetical protein
MINSENTIIFTIGRMNPPTPGHIYLLENMMNIAIKDNVTQINIILSATIDSIKNPIECEEKRQILYNYGINAAKEILIDKNPDKKEQIENIKTEIVCLDDETDPDKYGYQPIVAKLKYILTNIYGYPKPGLKTILVIGEDRANDFTFFKDMLMKWNPTIEFDKFIVGRPSNAMSATEMRRLATSTIKEDEDKFLNYMNTIGMKSEEGYSLINQIRDNITTEGPPTKKARKSGGRKKYKTYKNRKNIGKKNRYNKTSDKNK